MNTHTLSAAEYLREVCFENRPSQADVEKLYPDLQDEIGKGGKRDARKSYGEIAKKMGVKAPYARTYGDVNRVGKDQGLGFFRRHSTAIATRPSVWANNNAFFLPRGRSGMVITGKNVGARVLAHEAGHAKDYERHGGEKGWKKEYERLPDKLLAPFSRGRYIRTTMLPEHRAWAESGVAPDDTLRTQALRTYANAGPGGLFLSGRKVAIGSAVGAAVGIGAVAHHILKQRQNLSSLVEGMIALEGRADAVLFGSDPEERPSLLRRAAGVLGTAALVGGAAYGTNRLVQGHYGNQGAGSWGAAADEAKLRFRSAWGAPRAAITPPVVGAPVSDYVAPGAIVASNVRPSVGGVASTRKVAGNFKQMPVGTLAADARRVGRYTLQNVVRGPLLPKQRFSAADYLAEVVFLDRARNADGQFDPGQAAMSPEAMAAAYPAPERPGVSALIAASHRRRMKRDLMAGGIGAAAGAAVGAGAIPAWQYLRQVVGRA